MVRRARPSFLLVLCFFAACASPPLLFSLPLCRGCRLRSATLLICGTLGAHPVAPQNVKSRTQERACSAPPAPVALGPSDGWARKEQRRRQAPSAFRWRRLFEADALVAEARRLRQENRSRLEARRAARVGVVEQDGGERISTGQGARGSSGGGGGGDGRAGGGVGPSSRCPSVSPLGRMLPPLPPTANCDDDRRARAQCVAVVRGVCVIAAARRVVLAPSPPPPLLLLLLQSAPLAAPSPHAPAAITPAGACSPHPPPPPPPPAALAQQPLVKASE